MPAATTTRRRRTTKPTRRPVSYGLQALTKAINAMTELSTTLNVAMFGRWDKETNKKIPGVVDDIKTINERMDARDKRDRVTWFVLALFLSLGAANSIGVPTKEIGQSLAQQFWQAVVTHAPPP
jgi:hypothetical protein